jgi:large subunit ribosomal protein LP1
MARVPVANLDKETHAELVCTYAALILHDDGVEISGTNIRKLLDASNNKVDSFWPSLFAKALHGRNIADLLVGGGNAGPAAGGAAAGAGTTTNVPAAGGKPEPKKDVGKRIEKIFLSKSFNLDS